jgi:hypothetical protein
MTTPTSAASRSVSDIDPSAERFSKPTVLGQPCWSPEAIGRSITSVARLDPKLAHYFLATHAPIDRVRDETRNITIGEHDVFKRLLDPTRSDVLIVVHGEPGTGKSHLIRWLHLRCQYEQDQGRLQHVMPVLVQRRTGSLKDALEQIVEQLPPAFAHHLTRVREAIGTLTADAARAVLANALQVELGPNWVSRGNAPRESVFNHLDQACLSNGFRTWLCRDGGVIDRVIRQLTEQSDVLDRLSLPPFVASEFEVPAGLLDDNTRAVQALIDEFEFTPELRAKAGRHFDAALRPAIKEMSGLAGTRLRDVFAGIRRDLKMQGKELAVFIEDVSVMAALDEDVLNAVEPDPREEFCRLMAVVGMTEVKLKALRDNQQSRVTDFLSLGGDVLAAWRDDPASVARFAARYLNVVRLDEASVREVAADREPGGDVRRSACHECPVRDDCHKVFGAVTFGEERVGLFPFTGTAPQRLLTHLDEQRKGVRQNARGLLEHVLRPVLADCESLESHAFPRAQMAVNLSVPTYWREFERKYLGSWSTGDKNRIRSLTHAWITARNEDEAAQTLEPVRGPLGFPAFTRLVDAAAPKTSDRTDAEETAKPQESRERAGRQPISPELQALLDHLHAWRSGQRLTKDDEPRRLVHELLSTSIPWEEERIPRHVVDSIIPDKSYVRFEDQRSKTRGLFEFFLPRDDTTLGLAEALGRCAYLGQRGRSYAGIEADRRTIARWLRANRPRFVALLQPALPLTTDAPLLHAIRTLSVAAVLRRGTGLPPDSVGLLRELLAEPVDVPQSVAFNPEESAIVDRVQGARAVAKDFLVKEINRPQGTTGGILFIDPLPVLAHARRTLDNARIEPLPAGYTANGSHWKARYQAVAALPTADLTPLLDARRVGIKGALSRVRMALVDAGLSGEVVGELATYCTHIVALIDAQKTSVSLDSPNVNGIRQILSTRAESWESLLAGAFETAEADAPLSLLTFAAETFRTAVDAIAQADGFLKALNREVTSQEKSLNADGDPVKMFDEMKTALGEITGAAQGTAGSTVRSDGEKNA